jgi:ribose 5-phosphate isomerase RpiB
VRIAVVTEVSTLGRNADVVAALQGRGHDVANVGMRVGATEPELTYINTGFLAALLLATGRADFVVGGCGTGQGFLMSVSQYPGVACGHVVTPLDAWLFAQINAGNCISLALNQGYGWAAGENLRMVFDELFRVEAGAGYPPARRDSQRESRAVLAEVRHAAHRPVADVVRGLPERVLAPVLARDDVWDALDVDRLADASLAEALRRRRAALARVMPQHP